MLFPAKNTDVRRALRRKSSGGVNDETFYTEHTDTHTHMHIFAFIYKDIIMFMLKIA